MSDLPESPTAPQVLEMLPDLLLEAQKRLADAARWGAALREIALGKHSGPKARRIAMKALRWHHVEISDD